MKTKRGFCQKCLSDSNYEPGVRYDRQLLALVGLGCLALLSLRFHLEETWRCPDFHFVVNEDWRRLSESVPIWIPWSQFSVSDWEWDQIEQEGRERDRETHVHSCWSMSLTNLVAAVNGDMMLLKVAWIEMMLVEANLVLENESGDETLYVGLKNDFFATFGWNVHHDFCFMWSEMKEQLVLNAIWSAPLELPFSVQGWSPTRKMRYNRDNSYDSGYSHAVATLNINADHRENKRARHINMSVFHQQQIVSSLRLLFRFSFQLMMPKREGGGLCPLSHFYASSSVDRIQWMWLFMPHFGSFEIW